MPPIYFADAAAFGQWLATNAASASELAVGFYKRGSGRPSLSWPEAVDEALCVGWIDGVRRRIDDQAYQIRFTPRRAGSHWSAVNIARMAVLGAAGRLQPAGLAAWALRSEARSARAAYEQADPARLPPAALAVFQAEPAAWAFFRAQPPGYRHQMVWWVISAKRPETQVRRLQSLVETSARGQRR